MSDEEEKLRAQIAQIHDINTLRTIRQTEEGQAPQPRAWLLMLIDERIRAVEAQIHSGPQAHSYDEATTPE